MRLGVFFLKLLRYLKGNESESKSQLRYDVCRCDNRCCVTSKVMNLKANHNGDCTLKVVLIIVALP